MIFYRHPTPEAAPGLCYGRTDLDISDEGRQQVLNACAAPPAVSRILSSPAKRALALAAPLAEAAGARLDIDERLWELNFGAWEGMLWSEIDRAESDPWAKDVFNRAPPDGETYGEVLDRMAAVIGEVPDSICLVTHAGPIRAAHMVLERTTFDEVFARPVPFAEPIIIRKDQS